MQVSNVISHFPFLLSIARPMIAALTDDCLSKYSLVKEALQELPRELLKRCLGEGFEGVMGEKEEEEKEEEEEEERAVKRRRIAR